MKKKMMELTTQTHKVIETVKATIEAANEKLRRANANLSQLWVTAKETLNKVNENEEKTKEIIKSNVSANICWSSRRLEDVFNTSSA